MRDAERNFRVEAGAPQSPPCRAKTPLERRHAQQPRSPRARRSRKVSMSIAARRRWPGDDEAQFLEETGRDLRLRRARRRRRPDGRPADPGGGVVVALAAGFYKACVAFDTEAPVIDGQYVIRSDTMLTVSERLSPPPPPAAAAVARRRCRRRRPRRARRSRAWAAPSPARRRRSRSAATGSMLSRCLTEEVRARRSCASPATRSSSPSRSRSAASAACASRGTRSCG